MTDQPTNAVLEAGLAAIKWENYGEAIPILENYIAQVASAEDPQVLKARMGLIVAYDRTQQFELAIAHCQRLSASPNPKVKAWADRTLTHLQQRRPPSSPATGFMPLDATGFVPLAAATSAAPLESVAPADRPVFVPQPDGSQPPRADQPPSQSPPADSNPTPALTTDFPSAPAGRAAKWSAIAPLAPFPLIAAQWGTAIALWLTLGALAGLNMALPLLWFRIKINLLGWSSYPPDTNIPGLGFGLLLVGLWIASPWMLDFLLRQLYGLKPLSTATLARYSPETHRLLQRFCQQRRLPLFQLNVLPTPAPLIFTYGSLPQLARLVVSQGLLEQLTDDEIATLYGAELGHIHSGDFSVMSLVAVVTQLPYALYRLAAQGGDWLRQRSQVRRSESAYIAITLGIAADLLAIAAALSYGTYWLLRGPGLWLSKQRVAYSDRFACNLTGNPNGLTRALLKMATGTAQTLQHQQQTDPALESFDLLSALNHRPALAIGSVAAQTPWPALLTWDQVNPQRRWLALNQSHPLLGERLQTLDRYAQKWQLSSELALSAPTRTGWQLPWPQALPFAGLGSGLALAALLWVIGWGAYLRGIDQLRWMASDYKLFFGLPLIGFGVGTILRFNRFFPDLDALTQQRQREDRDRARNNELSGIKPSRDKISVATMLTQSSLPVGQPTVLEGTLLGRSGIGNGLGQDLLLQTANGTLKLRYCAQVGVVGNLLIYSRIVALIGQPVVAIGWFRRGAEPWLDLDTLQGQGSRPIGSGHQIWAVLLASLTTLLGIALIL
jgi:Zn-dependent protease with chaperone function